MSKKALVFLILMLALVAVANPAPARAVGATVPFYVDCTTYPEVDASGFPLLVATIPSDCIGTHLGNSHWFSVAYVLVEGPPPWYQWGDMDFTSADGSQLFGYYEGHYALTASGGAEWWGRYWITGGSGRFEGYTGEGDYYGGGDGMGNAYCIFDGDLTKP